MPALTKTCSSRPTPPWRPHNRNSPPQQGKGGNAAAAMTPACPKPTKNQSYAEPVQLSRPEYPSQSPTHHADTQISPITLKSSASKTPREKSGYNYPGQNIHLKARPTTPTLRSARSPSNPAPQKRLVRSPGLTSSAAWTIPRLGRSWQNRYARPTAWRNSYTYAPSGRTEISGSQDVWILDLE